MFTFQRLSADRRIENVIRSFQKILPVGLSSRSIHFSYKLGIKSPEIYIEINLRYSHIITQEFRREKMNKFVVAYMCACGCGRTRARERQRE